MTEAEIELVTGALRKFEDAAALLRIVLGPAAGPPPDAEFLETPLVNIQFGKHYQTRLQRLFRDYSEYTPGEGHVSRPLVIVRDLVTLSESQLMHQNDVGQFSINLLKRVLSEHGLHFGMMF